MQVVKFIALLHHAKRAGDHTDFRIQKPDNKDMWRSFAIRKGLPEEPGIKVMGVNTPDHATKDALFSGTIPNGEYGAGHYDILDSGKCIIHKWSSTHMAIELKGKKYNGMYHLIRFKNPGKGKSYKGAQYMIFKGKIKS